MKDPIYPLNRVLLFLAFVLMTALKVDAQSNPNQKHFTILTNTVLTDTVQSLDAFGPTLVVVPGFDYQLEVFSLGANSWQIEISFDQVDFVGHRDVVVEYWKFEGFIPMPGYISYSIDVVPSLVTAQDDVITKGNTDTLVIYPMTNDYSSTDVYNLYSVNDVLYGEAEIEGDSIIYVGSSDDDIILYSLRDSLASTDQGVIFIRSSFPNHVGNDTLMYSLVNTSTQYLMLPNESFERTIDGTLGEVKEVHSLVGHYIPEADNVGVDTVIYTDDQGNSRMFILTILDPNLDEGYVKDDVFFTGVDETVSFNVFSNDLISGGILLSYSPELLYVGNGVFEYTPPNGFQGEKSFYYEKDFGLHVEIGEIKMVVGNMKPTKTISYELNALMNKSYLVDYDIPLDGYSFNIVNSPLNGQAEIINIEDTTTINCDVVTNKIGVSYTPNLDFIGQDEFDVEYCLNGICEFYKLRFNVVQPQIDTTCNCVADCIWSGDANGDGRVSVTDVLSIGRYMGEGGPVRDEVNQGSWSSQYLTSWNQNQISGVDVSHVDTDNNGVVTSTDTSAVTANYGKVHTLVPEEILVIKDYPFYLIPQSSEVDSGDLLVIDMVLGNANYPVLDAHGFTFSLNIPPNLIDSSSFDIQFDDNSWFANNSIILDYAIHKSEGKIDVAFSRTTGVGISGLGKLGQLSFIVEEDAHGIKTNDLLQKLTYQISATNIVVEDSYGSRAGLNDAVTSVDVILNKAQEEKAELILYPNPAEDYMIVHLNGNQTMQKMSVVNIQGVVLEFRDLSSRAFELDLTSYNEGMYFIQVESEGGTYSKKFFVKE